jgi:hypothetical protein
VPWGLHNATTIVGLAPDVISFALNALNRFADEDKQGKK